MARRNPEPGRRLGRGRLELQARLSRLRARAGTSSQTAWALLGLMAAGEVDHPAPRARDRLSHAHAGRRRTLERATLYGGRLSAHLLPALSRLFEVLPALGLGALPQSQARQQQGGGVRDVGMKRFRLIRSPFRITAKSCCATKSCTNLVGGQRQRVALPCPPSRAQWWARRAASRRAFAHPTSASPLQELKEEIADLLRLFLLEPMARTIDEVGSPHLCAGV